MSSPDSAEGRRFEGAAEEVKPNLFQVIQENVVDGQPNVRRMCMWNASDDKMMKVTVEFLNPDVTPGPDGVTQVSPTKWACTLYPQEGKEIVTGSWSAFKRGFAIGRPDAAWMDRQRKKAAATVNTELEQVLALFKAKGVDPETLSSDEAGRMCFEAGIKFVDHKFPPTFDSLSQAHEYQLKSYPWMRPAAYCGDAEPCLYVGTIEPNDIDQGMLGDCYFMCALACLSEFPELVKRQFRAIQRPDNGFYRCLLCKDGLWQTIVVDDLLPMNPATNRPVFAKNREEPNELWVSMLEKAYAKVHGSYAAIKAGDPALALANLVGGPYEKFNNRPEWEDSDAMFDFLMQCDEDDHLMSLGTPGVDTSSLSGSGESGDDLSAKYSEVGLCTGHAFSLIRVKRSHGHRLCMIRNPWGNEMEWNGDWSDDSDKWTQEIKDDVGFYAGDDGTFWMCWDDVRKWFTMGSVTYVLNSWSRAAISGNFANGVPNVALKVTVAEGGSGCWFGLHQPYTRGWKPDHPWRKWVGLMVVVLKEENGKTVRVASNSPKLAFQTMRDVYCEAKLDAGTYYIVGQCYQEADRPYVLSALVEHDEQVKVDLVTWADDAAAQRYLQPAKLPLSALSRDAQAPVQISTERCPIPLSDEAASHVNWQLRPTREQLELIKTVQATEVDVIPGEDDAPAPAAAAGAAPASGGGGGSSSAPAATASQPAGGGGPAAGGAGAGGDGAATDSGAAKPVCPAKQRARGDTTVVTRAQARAKADPKAAEEKAKRNMRLRRGYLEKYSTGRNAGGLRSMLVPSAFNWKKRFFRLFGDGRLCYYENDQIAEPLDELAITAGVTQLIPKAGPSHHSNASSDKEDMVLVFFPGEGDKEFKLLVRCTDADDRKAWVQAIEPLLVEQVDG